MSCASCVFSLVLKLWACAVAYLVVSKCLEIWSFRRHYFRFRSVIFFFTFSMLSSLRPQCWELFLKNSVNREKIKNEFQNARIFTKKFLTEFYISWLSGKMHNFKTVCKIETQFTVEFSRKLNIFLFVGLYLKALCVAICFVLVLNTLNRQKKKLFRATLNRFWNLIFKNNNRQA